MGRKKKSENNDFDNKLNNVNKMENEIKSMLGELESLTDELTPPENLLPGLDFEYTKYNYDKDIELIKDEAKETLECISSLYLDEIVMKRKNIMSIIKNDSETISDIKFSLSCAKRGLIICMQQIDAGSNDPEMHEAVNAYQKEIRDSSKMINDLLTKMKSFYKELRDEYERKEINEQIKLEGSENSNKIGDNLVIFDQKKINELVDMYKKDPTLLK